VTYGRDVIHDACAYTASYSRFSYTALSQMAECAGKRLRQSDGCHTAPSTNQVLHTTSLVRRLPLRDGESIPRRGRIPLSGYKSVLREPYATDESLKAEIGMKAVKSRILL
jgi:hypothetical protein